VALNPSDLVDEMWAGVWTIGRRASLGEARGGTLWPMAGPSGTVTFLFTDIEGSTRLWQLDEVAMREAVRRHDELVGGAIESHDGLVFSTSGDGMGAAFPTAASAVAAALEAQRSLGKEDWPEGAVIRVRMGLHTGEAQERGGDYFGTTLNRTARLMEIGHGGEILCSAPTASLIEAEVPLIDLGEHRLRDLDRPLRVYQVGEGVFPPLRSLHAFPGNLPLQVSSFIGREHDLARVAKALEDSRVVTLTGVGGVGKTRLALQVAAEVLPRFKDGAWLCELASVRDPDQVIDAVAGALRVTARPGWDLEDSVIAYLRGQELLLVLDNCEHLLRPVARLVVAIEAAGAGIRVLATSREGLNIRAEQQLTVPSLGLPDDPEIEESAGECESVRLFAERARAVKADFVVDDANRGDVVALCLRLDGVALAIELAAARTAAMSPSELVRRLDRRFRLLSGGERTAIERHQTLRAAIDWSYDLLSEPEQRLLARLSVFAGGFTLEAAEAVCADDPIEVDDVFELLATLVARSLVLAETGAETRYRLLETIRQYGEERLAEAGETDALRARHADHYIEFAGIAARGMWGPDQREWGARLAREHDNLHAAMAFALDTEDLERAMSLLCAAPAIPVQVDNPVVFDPAPVLALPGADEHPGSASALMATASRASMAGDYPLALELVDRALEVEQRLGPAPDSRGLDLAANGQIVRETVLGSLGTFAESAALISESAERLRAMGLHGLAAIRLGTAAMTLTWVNPDMAITRATEGLTLARQSGMPSAIAMNLVALAMALAPSDPQGAAAYLAEAERVGVASVGELGLTVFAAARLADWSGALRAADRLLRLDRQTGTTPLVTLLSTFNFVARGLAERQPEAAAVLQGVPRGLSTQASHAGPGSIPQRDASGLNPAAAFIAEVRRDTSRLLVAAIGEDRMRPLRAEGQTMDRDQASTYARTHIHEYFAPTIEGGNG
jgi:predicted ATPase/class 3 adenylate cyclase